jgi:hypothetical protein
VLLVGVSRFLCRRPLPFAGRRRKEKREGGGRHGAGDSRDVLVAAAAAGVVVKDGVSNLQLWLRLCYLK